MTHFGYHEIDDIVVFEHGDYDNYGRSIDVANFVVDLDEDGQFLGLEVIGASERIPLNKKQLSQIEEVEINIQEDGENKMITITMKQGKEQTSLNLPVTNLNGQPA